MSVIGLAGDRQVVCHEPPLAIVLLGASIAAAALIEGFVLWIVAYLRALLEAVVAIIVTLLIAAYVKGQLGASRTTDDHI